MMIIRKILFASIVLLGFSVYGQSRLTGKVTSETGEELTGATIYIVNKDNRSLNGTVADINGNFVINMPNESNLSIVCSFIGFKTKKVAYTTQTVLNFKLEDDTQSLAAVEIVGEKIEQNSLGIIKPKQTSAAQKFEMDELEKVPLTSVEAGLQGRLANVDIISGADPGSRSSIRIRGTASLNANAEPLIVVDGIPYPTTISSDFNFSTANDQDFGALINISPNDIESIEVLKDAAATAIWGSQGANGVLIFTTKKGSQGRTKFSFTSKMDMKKEPNTIPLLNGSQYVSLMQDGVWNSINDIGFLQGFSYTTILDDAQEISFDPTWIYFDEYNVETNWMKEVTHLGHYADNNFSLSGGGEKATYRISLGYLNDVGTTIGTALNRFNSRVQIDYRFSNKLRFNANLSYSHSDRDNNFTGFGVKTPRAMAMLKMPNMSPYVIDENGDRTDQYFSPVRNFQGSFGSGRTYNPVAMVNEAINNTIGKNAIGRISIFYNFTDYLLYSSIISLDIRSTKSRQFLPQSVTGVLWEDLFYNFSSDALSDELHIISENKLIYNRSFGKHDLVATGILRTIDNRNAGYASATSGSATSQLSDPTAGADVALLGSGTSENRNISMISNVHYTYNGKYIASAGLRSEGNSSLGIGSRWGAFSTVSAGWIFSEEGFLKSRDWLNYGKFRVSWGQNGNPPGGSYPYVGTFSPINPGYITMDAIRPASIQLDNLKWETVTQTNIGVDLNMFDKKLNVVADVYNKLTTDLLQKDTDIPTTTGFSSVRYYNSGELINKGWELSTVYQIMKTKNYALSVNFNVSQNINEVTKLPDNKKFENYDFDNGNYAHKIVEGNPIGSFYGYRYLGVYQNIDETYVKDAEGGYVTDINDSPVYYQNGNRRVFPGDAKYEDVNGDGVINQYDIVYLGNAMPILLGGGGFSATYKSFLVSGFFYWRYGQKVVNNTRIDTENMRGNSNQSLATIQRWRIEGDQTSIPRALYGEGYNTLGSDRFVEDASFIRLKNVVVQYTLPRRLLSQYGLEKASIWFTGTDLYTWTKYTGQDPEVPLSSTNIYQLSVDNANTPRPRRYSLGITLNF